MLAVDLERLCGDPGPVDQFLESYLSGMKEDVQKVKPLLEYYITEKAMVCMYVSVLFDGHEGERKYVMAKDYLRIALSHAKRLKELVEAEKVSEVAYCISRSRRTSPVR